MSGLVELDCAHSPRGATLVLATRTDLERLPGFELRGWAPLSITVDNRIVVLLKSLRTNNRFYALVAPDRGLKNADAIADFPSDLILGIAYPCLEDGLNDFAVIRTTFETIDLFPGDDELRREMMAIIADARSNLVRRLEELRDKIVSGQAHFLGTDLQEFKSTVMHMVHRGTIRRQLDSMMKVDVFESVSKVEAARDDGQFDPMYRYEFLPQHPTTMMDGLPSRQFVGRLFDDVLDAVQDDRNYSGRYRFDRDVFQKFIAVMFVNYATTDQKYHGTSREDYGVSADKDMQETPLYQAIATAIADIERGVEFRRDEDGTLVGTPRESSGEDDLTSLFQPMDTEEDFLRSLEQVGSTTVHTIQIPFGTEHQLQEKLAGLAEAVQLLHNLDVPHAAEVSKMVASAGQQIFRTLQELEILSPLASDPFSQN